MNCDSKSREVRFVTSMSKHRPAVLVVLAAGRWIKASKADSLRRCQCISHAILAFLLAVVWVDRECACSWKRLLLGEIGWRSDLPLQFAPPLETST